RVGVVDVEERLEARGRRLSARLEAREGLERSARRRRLVEAPGAAGRRGDRRLELRLERDRRLLRLVEVRGDLIGQQRVEVEVDVEERLEDAADLALAHLRVTEDRLMIGEVRGQQGADAVGLS